MDWEIDASDIVEKNLIGKGSFGTVWKSEWKHTVVAVKRIQKRSSTTLFEREFDVMTRMHQLNTSNCGVINESVFSIVMEYPNGILLTSSMGVCRLVPRRHLKTCCVHSCTHTRKPQQCIHRDVKPRNIRLVGREAKIADLGLSRMLSKSAASHATVLHEPATALVANIQCSRNLVW